MRRVVIIALAFSLLCACGGGGRVSWPEGRLSVDSLLEAQLCATDLLHAPLPLDTARSLEAEQLSRPVLHSEVLPVSPDLRDWQLGGLGTLT